MRVYIYKINNNSNYIYKFVLITLFNIILSLYLIKLETKKGKKIGIVGVRHEVNIGNNLIKYAISIKLKELGYIPYIIGTHWNNFNITFINENTNLIIIHDNFSEIKEDDYDALIVNSDQTWRKFDEFFFDYGFLKFAEHWNIKKFVYGASLGFDDWKLSLEDDLMAKNLLQNFSGISVREQGSIPLIKEHFGVIPECVLDPTLLIDKKYYLNIIKNYHGKKVYEQKYIFIYAVLYSKEVIDAMNNASEILNYDKYYFKLSNKSTIQDFIYYLDKSSAVITNSFHGTIFAIMFNKPFITIYDKFNAKERYSSVGNLFNVHERLFENGREINYNLLLKPLKINTKLLNQHKLKSINFLKENLEKII